MSATDDERQTPTEAWETGEDAARWPPEVFEVDTTRWWKEWYE